MKLTTLLERRIQHVAAMPDGSWLVPGEKEGTVTWGGPDQKPRTLAVGGKRVQYHVVGLCGLEANACVLTDGVGVVHAVMGDTRTMKRPGEWSLPGELGWHAFIAATPDAKTILVASDGRLARLGEVEKIITEPKDFERTFRAVALLPGAQRFVVGRGDGHVEVRDATTLEVVHRWSTGPGPYNAVLELCVLDERTVAVALDTARTVLLDITSGVFTELGLRMKTAGLHRLADGRLLVVGLSRKVTLFDGTTRVREADLSAELGDRYIQKSALAGDTLLLACEERGLRSLRVDELPEAREEEGVAFADPLQSPDFLAFQKAVAEKSDVTELLSRLLTSSDDYVLHSVLRSLVRAEWPVPAVGDYLGSPIARVRYYAADFFGQFPKEFAPRMAELKPLLADADASVVAAAAWALGQIGDAVAADWLTPLLHHAEHSPRVTAAMSLLSLNRGHADIAKAIADGAGEICFALLTRYHPTLNATLAAPLTEAQVTLAKNGLTLDDVLRETGTQRASDFTPTGVEGPMVVHTWVGAPTVELLYRTALTRRWACTFADERVNLVRHDAAAQWWAETFARPAPASGNP